MTVRLWPRACPGRTLVYGAVASVTSDGTWLRLLLAGPGLAEVFKLRSIAEIALDEDAGGLE